MNAREFEELIAELLRSMGFVDVKRVGRTADRGVDVEAYQEDAFGYKTKYIVQCKFYDEGLVSSPEIQKFVGAMSIHGASRGIFVTSSTFTTEAQEIASQNDITLIDGEELNSLIEYHNLEQINKKTEVILTSETDNLTYLDLYNSLSFGDLSKEPFIIPNIEPLALVEGLTLTLENIATINLNDIIITDARIDIRGFFGVHWSVNKLWHDSQGRVRKSWRGKGLYVTDEQGNEVHDVGSRRSGLQKSPLVNYIKLSNHKDWREISKKFNINIPKIKRVAYKKRIRIKGIPNKDIYCQPNKYYIVTKIIIEYKHHNKFCSIIADCISGEVENNLPIYTEDEIRRLAIRERPELEIEKFSIKLIDDIWNIESSNIHLNIHKYSGNIIIQQTPAEIIIEETSKEAKKNFKDAQYDKNIILKIIIGKSCESHWELSYTSKNGKIYFKSTLSGKYTYTKQINENYALELAQKENINKSELLGMKRDAKGFTFHFLDDKYDWELLVDIEGRVKLISNNLTWNEAIIRASQFLINEGVREPNLITSLGEKAQETYDLTFTSELDGAFTISISNKPSEYSCDVTKQKIKEPRARYLAETMSHGEVISFKRRFFGLANSWNAEIIDQNGEKKKIRIQGDGVIK